MCTATPPPGAVDWPLLVFSCLWAFSVVKQLPIYCNIYTAGDCSTPQCPGIAFRTSLIPSWLLLQHKGGRFKFFVFANHSSHICTRKHCSSQGATPSMLITVRSTTEPPCDVSQSIYNLEQMNTYSTLWFQRFFLFQLLRHYQKMTE